MNYFIKFFKIKVRKRFFFFWGFFIIIFFSFDGYELWYRLLIFKVFSFVVYYLVLIILYWLKIEVEGSV